MNQTQRQPKQGHSPVLCPFGRFWIPDAMTVFEAKPTQSPEPQEVCASPAGAAAVECHEEGKRNSSPKCEPPPAREGYGTCDGGSDGVEQPAQREIRPARRPAGSFSYDCNFYARRLPGTHKHFSFARRLQARWLKAAGVPADQAEVAYDVGLRYFLVGRWMEATSLDDIPDEAGTYAVFRSRTLLYIGSSDRLRERVETGHGISIGEWGRCPWASGTGKRHIVIRFKINKGAGDHLRSEYRLVTRLRPSGNKKWVQSGEYVPRDRHPEWQRDWVRLVELPTGNLTTGTHSGTTLPSPNSPAPTEGSAPRA